MKKKKFIAAALAAGLAIGSISVPASAAGGYTKAPEHAQARIMAGGRAAAAAEAVVAIPDVQVPCRHFSKDHMRGPEFAVIAHGFIGIALRRTGIADIGKEEGGIADRKEVDPLLYTGRKARIIRKGEQAVLI